jgi:lipoate-protein ligase A
MAVDEALMDAARRGRITLRFYRWDPPSVSLGRNEAARGRYDRAAARRRGIDFVRRPTGGRAVYHHRELTYAVVAPADVWGGLRESYHRVNRALLRGLASLGAAAEAASGVERAPGPSGRACFRDPLAGEIVADGRKLVGSAQWRNEGALLQHGSLLLHDDQTVVEELRSRSGERAGAAALSELLPELPDPRALARALEEGFTTEFGLPVEEGELEPAEEERAGALEPRYRGEDWTWRR